MRLPEVRGTIERRLLVNYRVDPTVASGFVPEPFRPQLVDGAAVAGICLIRLGELRPRGLPRWVGLRSENAAHRIAVEWDGPDGPCTGVYIPRRDSDSVINVAMGGRVYPGEHHRATFRVSESEEALSVGFSAADGSAEVQVDVQVTDRLVGSRLFADLETASAFFEHGSLGYTATRDADRFDGLELQTSAWKVEPTRVTDARSSVFGDRSVFPPGTAELDCALLMRKVPVIWKSREDVHADRGVGVG